MVYKEASETNVDILSITPTNALNTFIANTHPIDLGNIKFSLKSVQKYFTCSLCTEKQRLTKKTFTHACNNSQYVCLQAIYFRYILMKSSEMFMNILIENQISCKLLSGDNLTRA